MVAVLLLLGYWHFIMSTGNAGLEACSKATVFEFEQYYHSTTVVLVALEKPLNQNRVRDWTTIIVTMFK